MRYLILVCLVYFLQGNINAQSAKNFAALQKKYPSEREIIVNSEALYQITVKQQKLKILKDTYNEYMIMNKMGEGNYSETFFTSELSPVRDYSAYTIRANGAKIKTELGVTKKSDSRSIFYDGVLKTEVKYKELEPGAKKVLETTTEFLDPAFLHKFIFGGEYPAEKMTFTVEVDKKVEIGYKIFNAENTNIQLKKKEKGNKTIYTWTATNLKGYEYESKQPSYLNYLPHIIIYIKSYPEGEKEVELFDDVPQLFQHYGRYVDKLNKEIDSHLKSITDEITEGGDDEEEHVKQIYYWVKDNIKYIAYENGYEGFIPREANFVCERKFGDCKDMASIITAMCQYKGIDNVKLAWIGSRKLPYTYTELPTPQVDNHMIAVYVKGDETIFLDATDQHTQYGLPTGFIQGKQAMVRLNKDKYVIKTVPIIAPTVNKTNLKINSKIDGSKVVGSGTIQLQGLAKTRVMRNLNYYKKEEQQNYFQTEMLDLGNNKFSIQDYSDKNRDNRDSTYSVDFDYEIGNYIVSFDNETYVDMFLKKMDLFESIPEDRKFPIEYNILESTSVQVDLALENKYEIDNIPAPLDIDNDLLSFHAAYEMKSDHLQLQYTFALKQIIIGNSSFDEWNESVDSIKKYIKESIILKSKK